MTRIKKNGIHLYNYLRKQFSQKTAYYAKVEALALTKKENEIVRHFALRVQQLVKKGWCNESPASINLKCNEMLTKVLPKELTDFANRRKVKPTYTYAKMPKYNKSI